MSETAGRADISVLVLAGARASGDALALAHGTSSKALIEIAGQPMLARVLRALNLSGCFPNAPYVSGLSAEALQQARAGEAARQAASISGGPAASLLGAIESGVSLPLLVTTCDHALLTPAMVAHFIEEALRSGTDLSIGLAAKETIQAEYPETKRTYIPFGGSPMSGCNLFFVATPDALRIIQFWRQTEQDRKRPLRIAWQFGLITALRLLIGRPDVHKAFSLISHRLGARVGAVIMPFAEAAIDVDSQDDLALVQDILSRRVSA